MKPLTANEFTIDSKYILPYLGKYETVVFVGTNTDNNLLFRLENSLTIIVVSPNNISVISNYHEPSQTTMNTDYTEQPFNLETALKHPEWVYFRNGEKPLEWHWFEKTNSEWCIIVTNTIGGNESKRKDGSNRSNRIVCDYDLILRVPYVQKWAVLRPRGGLYQLFDTEQEAKSKSTEDSVICVPFKIPAI